MRKEPTAPEIGDGGGGWSGLMFSTKMRLMENTLDVHR